MKSKIQKYSFDSQNINWKETGHGLYLISSGRRCLSHSHNGFNDLQKGFGFTSGDVIVCEYDGVDCKLRFIKNDVGKFEMPMIAPP